MRHKAEPPARDSGIRLRERKWSQVGKKGPRPVPCLWARHYSATPASLESVNNGVNAAKIWTSVGIVLNTTQWAALQAVSGLSLGARPHRSKLESFRVSSPVGRSREYFKGYLSWRMLSASRVHCPQPSSKAHGISPVHRQQPGRETFAEQFKYLR